MRNLFDEIDEAQVKQTIEEAKSQVVVMRDYQDDSVEGIFECWKKHNSTLLVLPTGTGKSVCFSEVMRRWQGGQIILMAHRQELIYQAVGHAERAGLKAGIEMGGRLALGSEDVIVTTYQTLLAEMDCPHCFAEGCDYCEGMKRVKRIRKFNPFDVGLLIVDEGHHAVADSYMAVMGWFQRNEESKTLLVTATPKRTDKKGLKNVCESVAYVMQLKEAIDLGWLVPIRQKFITVDGLDLSKVKSSAGDLAASGVQKAFLGTDEEEERLLHAVAKPTIDEASGRQIIVFSSGKDHAEKLTAAFNSYDGVTAAFVTESTRPATRMDIVKDFKAGLIQVLVNCMVFTEGFDAPATAVIANCRPTKSESLYAQMIGRVTRPLPGVVDGPETPEARRDAIANSEKSYCTVLDFVGNSGKHKLVSVVDVLAGSTVKSIDMEAALKVAQDSGETVDMEELAEKLKTMREEKEAREEVKKARQLITNTYATKADYTAVDVDIFAGAQFTAYSEGGEMATRGQCGLLKYHCGMTWKKATKLTKSEASALITAAKQNAAKVWADGFNDAKSLEELKSFGESLKRRVDVDRLISDPKTLDGLRATYKAMRDRLTP